MALTTEDIKKYKDSNLTILELYEKIAQEEQASLDNKKFIEDELIKYYDTFIGKYVKLKHNTKSYSFLFIEHNIFQQQRKNTRCVDFFDNKVIMELKFCNYLWLKPELQGEDWEFISEDEFVEYEKQIKHLISLVIK